MLSFIAKPFGILIKYIYEYLAFDSYGFAIILFTLFARILLFPLNLSQQRSMDRQQALMPEIEALKKKYGNDQKKLSWSVSGRPFSTPLALRASIEDLLIFALFIISSMVS